MPLPEPLRKLFFVELATHWPFPVDELADGDLSPPFETHFAGWRSMSRLAVLLEVLQGRQAVAEAVAAPVQRRTGGKHFDE